MRASALLLVLLALILPACAAGEGVSDSTAVQPALQIDPPDMLQRLCVDEGGDRGVRCSTFYFADAAATGWQAYVNAIIQTFYGLPAQAYVDLVTYVGDHFVPQTYGDQQTPVYAQQARELGDQGVRACYPIAESHSTITIPAGCDAVAVLIPRAGARSTDDLSLFPRSEYMSEIFGHLQSITTGIPEGVMRAALESALP